MYEQTHTTLPVTHPARATRQAGLAARALWMSHREIRLVQAALGEEPCCGSERRLAGEKAECPWETRCKGSLAEWLR
ncbi:MAG: hypothetical protein HUJ28_02605 [Chromatiales bacterium]|nr:hypothetical protein [Chromatiales bacterium]